MVNIEELVSKARASLEKTGDNKSWCRTDEIIALLEAGATPRHINEKLGERSYSHEVSYEGMTFVNITKASVQELEEYSKNK